MAAILSRPQWLNLNDCSIFTSIDHRRLMRKSYNVTTLYKKGIAYSIHTHSFLQYQFADCSIAWRYLVLPVMDEKHRVREINQAHTGEEQIPNAYSYPNVHAIIVKH